MNELLKLADVTVALPTPHRVPVTVLDEVSLRVDRGEIFGLIGESGSGKSTLLRTVSRLLQPGARVGGEISYCGQDLNALSERAFRRLRGREIGLVFQDPAHRLSPVRTVGDSVTEAIRLAGHVSRSRVGAAGLELLGEVGVAEPQMVMKRYPHELSGGLLQRVSIACALALGPRLLLADEPTTALDVTTQAHLLALLERLCRERDLALVFVTHDVDLAATFCDRIAVMYCGSIVEDRATAELIDQPGHPYTAALLGARPPLLNSPRRLPVIPGEVPNLGARPAGCPFRPRCPHADAACNEPPARQGIAGGSLRCHHPLCASAHAGDQRGVC